MIQKLEVTMFWITVFTYAVCFILLFCTGRMKKLSRFVNSFTIFGFTAHTLLIISRWIAAGHAPVTNSYELNLTGTWFAGMIYIAGLLSGRVDRATGRFVLPVIFLILGNSMILRTEPAPATAAYDSAWLFVHVVFAWLAFGCFLISGGYAIRLLLSGNRSVSTCDAQRLTIDMLDDKSYRFIVIGFINHAVMLISGAIWARRLWGRYWSWDALETWSLLTFMLYAFYLHARSFLNWKGRKAAWLAALGLLVLSISFWGVHLFGPSLHPGP